MQRLRTPEISTVFRRAKRITPFLRDFLACQVGRSVRFPLKSYNITFHGWAPHLTIVSSGDTQALVVNSAKWYRRYSHTDRTSRTR